MEFGSIVQLALLAFLAAAYVQVAGASFVVWMNEALDEDTGRNLLGVGLLAAIMWPIFVAAKLGHCLN